MSDWKAKTDHDYYWNETEFSIMEVYKTGAGKWRAKVKSKTIRAQRVKNFKNLENAVKWCEKNLC